MEREIKTHLVPDSQGQLLIVAIDEPGAGGANHVYEVIQTNDDGELIPLVTISFQNGPILEAGVNGITNEVLLALVIDRLTSFQAGPYPCDENAAALGYAHQSLHWLQERTRKRIAAKVEGLNLAIPSEPLTGSDIPEGAEALTELDPTDEDAAALKAGAEAEAGRELTQEEIDALDKAIAEDDANKETAGQTG